MNEDDAAALWFKSKIHAAQFSQRAGNRFVAVWRRIKHQEAAGAGAEKFAADGAGLARLRIPVVDDAAGDAVGETSFQNPAFVDDFAESVGGILLKIAAQLARQLGHLA